MSSKLILGYWDIRGVAAAGRLMLQYGGIDYEDKMYSCGPAPTFDVSSWFGVKFTLGLPFPNLPYVIDGDKKVTQSGAVFRYIARKSGLVPDDEDAQIRVDMIEGVLVDFRGQWATLCYGTFNDSKDAYITTTLPTFLKSISEFLGDHDFFGGKKLTYVDFMAYELLAQQRTFQKDCLNTHGNLQKFMKRVEDLPAIKAYLSSDGYTKLPINNKMALFNGKA